MALFSVLCGWAVAATFSVLFCPWFAGTPLRAPVAALALLSRLFRFSRHLNLSRFAYTQVDWPTRSKSFRQHSCT